MHLGQSVPFFRALLAAAEETPAAADLTAVCLDTRLVGGSLVWFSAPLFSLFHHAPDARATNPSSRILLNCVAVLQTLSHDDFFIIMHETHG